MRIVRDYFGVDRTTVTYENEISGVGGNAHEFFIVADAGQKRGTPAVRTTVHFTHEEMAHLLADYRENHPIEGRSYQLHLSAPIHGGRMARVWGFMCRLLRLRSTS